MEVLVVVGSDLMINTSANLCHKSYIQGLLENNCSVDLLTVGNKIGDDRIEFEGEGLRVFRYPMESVYEKIRKSVNNRKRPNNRQVSTDVHFGPKKNKSGMVYSIKRFIHSLYGPYEVYISWERRAFTFKKNGEYDLIISLSFPPVSHYLVHHLLEKKHITAKRWIQIWEDPWCQDLVFRSLNDERAIERAKKEEAYLLSVADEILYVSPITLTHQSELFPESSRKMRWLPVPTYYINDVEVKNGRYNVYGYFGDYSTQIRNLLPFYEAAKKEKIVTYICGASDKMFSSFGNIAVKPRISLQELKPIEDNTNVLVFLCNLCGGQIPGKIYQYSATRKTILFILDGTEEEQSVLTDYFGKFNRYVFCQNNIEDISAAIRKIERKEIQEVVNYPLKCFSPKEIVEKLLRKMGE